MSWLFGLRKDPGGPGPEVPPPPASGQGGEGGGDPNNKDPAGRMDAYRFANFSFLMQLLLPLTIPVTIRATIKKI
jgi:hypothetical protein